MSSELKVREKKNQKKITQKSRNDDLKKSIVPTQQQKSNQIEVDGKVLADSYNSPSNIHISFSRNYMMCNMI